MSIPFFAYNKRETTNIMGNKAAASISPAEWDSGKPKVRSIGSGVLPVAVSSIVAEYLSDTSSDYVKVALVGVQPINLCLSQKCRSPPYNEVLSMGIVSPEHPWVPTTFKIDKEFSITNWKTCLDFLEQKDPNYCSVAIEVLTVKLSMDLFSSTNILDDLQNTIRTLQEHLKSVKRVVIFVEYQACLIFSLKEAINIDTGAPQTVDQSAVLFEIIDDLKTCWKINYLNAFNVYAFYFSGVQRASEKYLARFICCSGGVYANQILKEEASRIQSSKIMWILQMDNFYVSADISLHARLCHAFRWKEEDLFSKKNNHLLHSMDDAFCFQDNHFVERIDIKSGIYGHALKLPCPSAPLIDHSRRSALIELKLEGVRIAIHLTDLNTGYFPHLRHLSVIRGGITGHLDSHRVPLLETLFLEIVSDDDNFRFEEFHPIIHLRAQSLLRCGRPWQLVANQTQGGWSLASYDESTLNPQDESKEDSNLSAVSPLSFPLIRELLLVASLQKHMNEWQTQLKGLPSLETTTDGHNDRILMWEPHRVEKITAFYTEAGVYPRFEFTEAILDQERILTSLECHNVSVVVKGATLPKLQSLEVNGAVVNLSDPFPHLQRLSLYETTLHSLCILVAPLLQSLHCYQLIKGQNFSICPMWLPELSSLQIVLFEDDPKNCPEMLDIRGLIQSPFTRVVFGNNMALTPFFDRCQLHKVSHLELNLNVLELPAGWRDMVWECETLTLNAYAPMLEGLKSEEPLIEIRLPSIPLVKTLTVTEMNCRVLLDSEMPNLTVCSLPSPQSLTPSLRCPALKRIRFTENLSESDRKRALDPATYETMYAQPSEIIIAADYELHTMAWDVVPKTSNVPQSDGPF